MSNMHNLGIMVVCLRSDDHYSHQYVMITTAIHMFSQVHVSHMVFCRYHYLAIFFVVFGGYAAMGHFLFGTNIEGFSNIGRSAFGAHRVVKFARAIYLSCFSSRTRRSLVECLKMAMGEIGIFPDMVLAAPGIAVLYFVSFVFIVVSIMIRFFVFCKCIFDFYTNGIWPANSLYMNDIWSRSSFFSTFFWPSLWMPTKRRQGRLQKLPAWRKMQQLLSNECRIMWPAAAVCRLCRQIVYCKPLLHLWSRFVRSMKRLYAICCVNSK